MATTKKTKENLSKLRIIVSAFEPKVIDKSIKEILQSLEKLGAKVKGPVPLPTKIKKWTVNRSTFIYEDSKEQFEMKVHRRLIDIVDPTQKIVESLSNLSLPSGVNIDIKLM